MVVLNIDKPTWTSLRLLQDSLAFMANDPKYRYAIKKEQDLYKYIIQEIYTNVDNGDLT